MNKKILLVEDDQHLNRSLTQMLSDEGYRVDSLFNGRDALRQAMNDEYQAIVLDLMLPEVDGWDFLQVLRQHKETPVLVLSAIESTNEKVAVLKSGADDYMSKPFDMHELFARIEVISRRPLKGISDTTLSGVHVNFIKRTATYDGRDVAFTPKEFKLIEALACQQGSPIDRFTLTQKIFGETSETLSSNVIDVHVSAIRSKTHRGFIHTARGKGFYIP